AVHVPQPAGGSSPTCLCAMASAQPAGSAWHRCPPPSTSHKPTPCPQRATRARRAVVAVTTFHAAGRASRGQRGDVGLCRPSPGLGPFRRGGRRAGTRDCPICVFFRFRKTQLVLGFEGAESPEFCGFSQNEGERRVS